MNASKTNIRMGTQLKNTSDTWFACFFETRFKYIKRRASLLARFTERTFLDPSGRNWRRFVVPLASQIQELQGGPPMRWPPASKVKAKFDNLDKT